MIRDAVSAVSTGHLFVFAQEECSSIVVLDLPSLRYEADAAQQRSRSEEKRLRYCMGLIPLVIARAAGSFRRFEILPLECATWKSGTAIKQEAKVNREYSVEHRFINSRVHG